MVTRRHFIGSSILAAAGLAANLKSNTLLKSNFSNNPVIISTWDHGIPANEAAWEVLNSGGRALDAVEKGVMVSEADPKISSVGFGGLPDRDGNVTLDACIMDEEGNCGSVAYLQNIMHAISVARLVMEKTPHVMLAGKGALDFALENGFKQENLLTPDAEKEWKKWLNENNYTPRIDKNNHDTIAMLAMDAKGNICGACTTSGYAFKLPGRIGDSPIIGAGLFVDNEIGAAGATGLGENVIKTSGSHLVVELMRNGYSPKEACRAACERIIKKVKNSKDTQVAFIALSRSGDAGAFSTIKPFQYALYKEGKNILIDSESLF